MRPRIALLALGGVLLSSGVLWALTNVGWSMPVWASPSTTTTTNPRPRIPRSLSCTAGTARRSVDCPTATSMP